MNLGQKNYQRPVEEVSHFPENNINPMSIADHFHTKLTIKRKKTSYYYTHKSWLNGVQFLFVNSNIHPNLCANSNQYISFVIEVVCNITVLGKPKCKDIPLKNNLYPTTCLVI